MGNTNSYDERDKARDSHIQLLKSRLDSLEKERVELEEQFTEEYTELKISLTDIKNQVKELKLAQSVAIAKIKQDYIDINKSIEIIKNPQTRDRKNSRASCPSSVLNEYTLTKYNRSQS